jgi:hypothetical protein
MPRTYPSAISDFYFGNCDVVRNLDAVTQAIRDNLSLICSRSTPMRRQARGEQEGSAL